jgi:hypothetical protein
MNTAFLAPFLAPFERVDAVPSLMMVITWFAVLRYFRYSGYGIALLSVVGTSLHEATHWIVGFLLRAKPVSVNLFPRRDGKNWVLGSVGFTGLNIFNSAFVAFAPLLLLGVAWGVFVWWLMPAYQDGQYLSWFIAAYVSACALFSSIPSSADVRIGALSALMYAAVGYGIWQVARG